MNTKYKLGANGHNYRVITSDPVLAEREPETLGYHFEGETIVCNGMRDESLHTVHEMQHAKICLRQGELMDFWSQPAGSDKPEPEKSFFECLENDSLEVENPGVWF